MAVAERPFLAAVLLLVSSGLLRSSPLPACPEPCTCQRAPLLNCSSSGLSVLPQHIQDTVTELDLSHNLIASVTLDRPLHNLRNVWLGNNSITRLSLCIERHLRGRHVRGRHLHRSRPQSRRECVSWAPTLQLLSVERNQLEQFPEGLEGSESLQFLHLSFNKISTLQPGDLSPMRQLIELHLQHNLISSLHPQMFEDLAQLQVLDLSFNKLTSLHPLMYLSLRNIGADVRLSGNRWQCDCTMRNLRRRLVYDSSRGLQDWSVVCTSPSVLSGKDLLQLEEDDLNCFHTDKRPELHQDVTVFSGSEILLTCSTQDSMWLTPNGHASVSQPKAGLLISDITEKNTGLYVCVSENHKVMSVFNLQISKIEGTRRKTRSLDKTSQQTIPQSILNRINQQRNGTDNSGITQSDFNLAVCLSVFITFLIAFIIGVLVRPCIDVLCGRIINKKSSTQTHTVSSVEQRQYDNEAYYNNEEIGNYRERGIDVSTEELGEYSNVQYYDTVDIDKQVNTGNNAVIQSAAARTERDTHANGDSSSENSLQQSSPEEDQRNGRELSGHTHNRDSKHIPDSVKLEKRRSSSSSSDSSQSDKVFNGEQKTQRDHTTPKSPHLIKDSVQQRAAISTTRNVLVPQISIEGGEIPGFSSEPFADWSPHKNNLNPTDPNLWQENGEQFEFSDSARSSCVFAPLNDSKQTKAPTSNKKMGDDTTSSSEAEPKDHAVNSGDHRNDTQRHAVRPKHSFSSHSSDSDGKNRRIKQETNKGSGKGNAIHVSDKLNSTLVTGAADTRKKAVPKPRTKWRLPSLGLSLGFTSQSKSTDTGAPAPSAATSSSSSSESESDTSNKINKQEQGETNMARLPTKASQIKRPVDIKGLSPHSDSSSSSDSADDTTGRKEQQRPGKVVITGGPFQGSQIKRPVDIKPSSPHSDSSSSSDSADDTTGRKEQQRPGKVVITGGPFQGSQIKRPVDIKPSSPHSDSSSSDSDGKNRRIKQETNKGSEKGNAIHVSDKLNSTLVTGAADTRKKAVPKPRTKWRLPSLGLSLGFTSQSKSTDTGAPAPSAATSSSSSSESENEVKTRDLQLEQKGGRLNTGKKIIVPEKLPTDLNRQSIPQVKWGLGKNALLPASKSTSSDESMDETTKCTKRQEQKDADKEKSLAFKVKSPASGSSSSSDSEDDTSNKIKKQEQGETNMARLPTKASQIKKPVDIKGPSPHSDSSSSSDSEDDTTGRKEQQRPGKVVITGDPFQGSQIKRPLDIKPSSPHSGSSSSSDSEAKTQNQMKKQEQGETNMARLPTKASQIKRPVDIKGPSPHSDSSSSSDSEDDTTGRKEQQRPGKVVITGDPFQGSQIKRPLDIKPLSPHSDSSSSSDSEKKTQNQMKKQERGETNMARVPTKVPQTVSHDPQTQWPAIELEHNTSIKRRLDFKVTSQASGSSSSSDSEKETPNQMMKPEQREMNMARHPSKESEIKRPLDIKPTSPHSSSSSSSSSDSEDERARNIERQRPGKVEITGLPIQGSQIQSHGSYSRWPALDLQRTTRIKRRLDFKITSPASDSSSDSEKETSNQMRKQEPWETNMVRLPTNVSQIKRPLDIKPLSPHSDSSSSSDSEKETQNQIKKQERGETNMARVPTKVPQTVSHDPQTQWPAIDLEHNTSIKRRLDFKVTSQASGSTSSSDSEKETQNQMKKLEQREMDMARVTTKESQIKRPPDIKPPSPHSDSSSSSNTEDDKPNQTKKSDQKETNMARLSTKVTQIKRPLDIKPTSPHSHSSSSSSDTEDEAARNKEKQRPGKVEITGLPFQGSKIQSHVSYSRWPAIDLEHTTRIKRRLDFKITPPIPESSSSSDSEKETQNQMKKQGQWETNMARLPTIASQIKRPLDIKPPSPHSDSSSSSDSEKETHNQMKKQERGETNMARVPTKVPQTVSHDPQTQWPAIELEHNTSIKRRLDFKVTLQASGSSSSSDSEKETPNQMMKPEQREMNMARHPSKESEIKRPLDIKPTSPHSSSSSSSSSDSEDERARNIERQRPGKVEITGLPIQGSQIQSHGSYSRWPALDLQRTTHIKRRLDFKITSPASDSSSDSEKETSNQMRKQEQWEANMVRLPTNVSQIKRPLDIKPLSPHSDSSSSSDSEKETQNQIKKQERGETNMARVPTKVPQTVSHDPQTQWPAIDLEHNTSIKRRLDFKVTSQASGSTSSSDSEKETQNQMKKLEQREMDMARVTTKESQIKRPPDIKPPSPHSDSSSSSDTEDDKPNQTKKSDQKETNMARLSTKVTQIKRPLDIKPTSPHSHSSSSSSDTEDEAARNKEKQRPGKVEITGLPFQGSKIQSHVSYSRWPAIDLEHTTRIKRRLDFKIRPPIPESSSSSDSEKETQNQMKKQGQWETNMARLPTIASQIKRPLDIKPPSPHSDSSSSSDSEKETHNQMKKQERGETNMARVPTKVPQIKRPLDIKPPTPQSDSSSSSDSEDELKHHTKGEKPQLVEVAGPLFQKSQTVSHDSGTHWPAVDLGNITHIKRRLDIKVLSPPLDSSLSGGGMIHTVEVKREKAIKNSSSSSSSSSDEQEEGRKDLIKPATTVEPNLGSRWPQLNLSSVPHAKRRLDIRARSPSLESSSSSNESEGVTPDLSLKVERDRADVGITSYQPRLKLPDLNLSIPHVNRTKRESSASPGSKKSESNSSGSESEAETRDHDKQGLGSSSISRPKKTEFISSIKASVIHTNENIKLEKYTVFTDNGAKNIIDNFNTTTVISPELESRWAKMNLNMSRFRKRLEITPRTQKPPSLPSSPKPDSSSSSSSDEDTGSKNSKTSYKRKGTDSSQIPENKPVNVPLSFKGKNYISGNPVGVKQTIRKDYGFPITEEKSNLDTMLTGFGTSHVRRNLDNKVSEKAPATPPLQQLSDSSSSSEDEDASTRHAGKGWQGRSQLPIVPDNKASQIHTSLHVAKAVNIKMDYAQSQAETEERKAMVKLKSQTSKVGGESDSVRSQMSLPHVPLQRKESSSNSEDEMVGHRVSVMNLGISNNKKDLNVKAPSTSSSSSSSSSSEDENELKGYTAKQSRHADESVITYKRSIFKTSSTPSSYHSHNGPTVGHTNQRLGAEMIKVAQGGPSNSVRGSDTSLASRSMSFEDVVKKKINQSKHTTDADLPPEIRWNAVGHQLSDLSNSSQRGYLDVALLAPPAEPDLSQVYSSNYSAVKNDSKIKQDRGTLSLKYSSLGDNSVSLPSTRALDQFDYSSGSTNETLKAVHGDRREMRGLGALKVMSSERRMWDTQDENLEKAATSFDVHGPQVKTSLTYQRSQDINPLVKQPLTQLHLSSTSVDNRRGTNLSYDVPHYRRHDLGGTSMQKSPPPIPNMPLLDEAVGLMWRSSQTTKKQELEGTKSSLQQSRNTRQSDPSIMSQNRGVHFDSSNINISSV